jgi:hypothetical protein
MGDKLSYNFQSSSWIKVPVTTKNFTTMSQNRS